MGPSVSFDAGPGCGRAPRGARDGAWLHARSARAVAARGDEERRWRSTPLRPTRRPAPARGRPELRRRARRIGRLAHGRGRGRGCGQCEASGGERDGQSPPQGRTRTGRIRGPSRGSSGCRPSRHSVPSSAVRGTGKLARAGSPIRARPHSRETGGPLPGRTGDRASRPGRGTPNSHLRWRQRARSAESRRSVTGPSLTSATCIWAAKTPRSTCTPSASRSAQKRW